MSPLHSEITQSIISLKHKELKTLHVINVSVAMVMLWGYLGPASLAGLALLIILVVMNLYLASKVRQLQVKTMKMKDKRTKQTNEILSGIKVSILRLNK